MLEHTWCKWQKQFPCFLSVHTCVLSATLLYSQWISINRSVRPKWFLSVPVLSKATYKREGRCVRIFNEYPLTHRESEKQTETEKRVNIVSQHQLHFKGVFVEFASSGFLPERAKSNKRTPSVSIAFEIPVRSIYTHILYCIFVYSLLTIG